MALSIIRLSRCRGWTPSAIALLGGILLMLVVGCRGPDHCIQYRMILRETIEHVLEPMDVDGFPARQTDAHEAYIRAFEILKANSFEANEEFLDAALDAAFGQLDERKYRGRSSISEMDWVSRKLLSSLSKDPCDERLLLAHLNVVWHFSRIIDEIRDQDMLTYQAEVHLTRWLERAADHVEQCPEGSRFPFSSQDYLDRRKTMVEALDLLKVEEGQCPPVRFRNLGVN